jgi:hypothetical protein
MKVTAAKGLKVPMENKPRAYITDADTVEVPSTAYYTRRIADGDLTVVKPARSTKTTRDGDK